MVITSRKLKRGGRSLGDVVRSRSSCCIHSNGCRLIPNQAVSTRLVGRRRDFHVCRFTNGLFGLCYQDIYLQQFAKPPKKPREDCAVPDMFLRTLLKLLAAASLNVKIIIALKDSKGQILTENKFKDPLGQIKAYFGTTLPAPFPSESMTKGSTLVSPLVFQFQKMGSFRRPRPRFMSSPVLTDLPRFLATRQSLQLNSNSAWNSVQTAVINVFKGGGLQNNELYTLNENVRRLLKSELGSFITDYFQNQLLAKGLLFIEEKVKLCEEENRIHALSEIWDHFFTETLPTLQAIFYPVQGQELTIRQIALLGFRDLILLRVKLGEILPRVQTKIPPSIVQMLLILQGVHEPTGPSKAFMQLEELVKQVVSPYLGLCEEHCFPDSTCALECLKKFHFQTGGQRQIESPPSFLLHEQVGRRISFPH
ncbi:proline-rich protein 5-like isoform X3 [Hemicordylus capensis]|uniref:proline-rich protein 5-like isoform X3 n=1 Tax=Hemicordylus capensis TaxID=884348 RepID=UPI002304AF14|nr:proline-rich protein 5-like isoform X3 [Hemicordylus capensis]